MTAINDLRYNRFAVSKTLVIAPKKVAEDTWSREAAKWDHLRHLRVNKVLGSQQKRIRALNTPGDLYVINRENVQWLVDYYKNAWPFDCVIIDELSSFKNSQSKRFKKLRLVLPHIKRLYGLTGTPAPNGLQDLWAQVYLLDQGQRLGRTLTAYREHYFDPDQRGRDRVYSYKPRDGSEQLINHAISDICISMKAEDYLDMPDRIDNTIPVVLDKKAQAQYDELERTLLLPLVEADQVIDAKTAAVLSNKLLQMCNGAVYDDDKNYHEIHGHKLERLRELVEDAQGKSMLVFYNFQHDKARILKSLKKLKVRIGELKDPGDITRWNNGELDVLLAHPASAAYGLNLQDGGYTIVWFGLNWSLELFQQANARLYRQGQKHGVIIHYLICPGTREDDVMAALQDKDATQADLLLSLKARIEKYQSELSGGNNESNSR